MRFNGLVEVIHVSLKNLQKALKGQVGSLLNIRSSPLTNVIGLVAWPKHCNISCSISLSPTCMCFADLHGTSECSVQQSFKVAAMSYKATGCSQVTVGTQHWMLLKLILVGLTSLNKHTM